MSKRNVFCVHGHFYQPPRENPITGRIPEEPGAAPFKNWNERIFDQCYRPNAELGNFARISFDLGPTLACWMEEFHPETLQAIVDQENSVYQSLGVSNGMAQSYNHTILPLATREDKVTQVRWGLADFEYRFGHKPQGMWMPETAADLETLQVMGDEGITFTIMAPWQAKKLGSYDTTQPYRVDLGNGKSMAVFFYNGDLSMKVSFMPEATVNADGFLYNELKPLYPATARRERMQLIASDGELYGHHQPFRDKFLEWLTTGALEEQDLEILFPAQWLTLYPPQKSLHIRNNTSWSCHHGVKRWSAECPCAAHGEWKAGLRRTFNRLAVMIDTEAQKALAPYGLDLLTFRDEYIKVLTHQETPAEQLRRILGKQLPAEEESRLLDVMRANYERQRMFTSCGWFFEDFDRIEARNNIAYAAMALRLIERVSGNKTYRRAIYRALTMVQSAETGARASTIFAHALSQPLDGNQ